MRNKAIVSCPLLKQLQEASERIMSGQQRFGSGISHFLPIIIIKTWFLSSSKLLLLTNLPIIEPAPSPALHQFIKIPSHWLPFTYSSKFPSIHHNKQYLSERQPIMNSLAFKYPPSIQLSTKHRLANRIFRKLDLKQADLPRCPCCGKFIGEESDVSLCYDPVAELQFLGPGVPLLFVFITNKLILLLFLLGVVTIHAFLSNLLSKSCSSTGDNCGQDFLSLLSISNKLYDEVNLETQHVLVFVMTAFWPFINQMIIYRFRKTQFRSDFNMQTPSDYAILIEDLPPHTNTQDILALIRRRNQQLLPEDQKATNQLATVNVIFPYNIISFEQQRLAEEGRFRRHAASGLPSAEFKLRPPQRPTEHANIAIVVFEMECSKHFFLQKSTITTDVKNVLCNWGVAMSQFSINKRRVAISRAPQPDDLRWSNLGKSKKHIFCNQLITFSFGVLLLILGGIIQYGLTLWQQKAQQQMKKPISVFSTIIVTITNYFISVYLIWSTRQEGNLTTTKEQRSLNVKICAFQFFNAGVFYALANILAVGFSFKNLDEIFSYKVTVFMILNAVTQPALDLAMGYFELPQAFERFMLKNGWRIYTQMQCNRIYEMPDSQLSFKHGYIVKTLWLTFFYTPFIPVVGVVSLIGLIIYYCTTKYLFRYHYKITSIISNQISRGSLRLSYLAPFALNLGQLLIYLYVVRNLKIDLSPFVDTIVYCSLGLSIGVALVPWYDINQKIFKFKERTNQRYRDNVFQFETTYESANPFYEGNKSKKDFRFLMQQCKDELDDPLNQDEPLSRQIQRFTSMEELPHRLPTIRKLLTLDDN